MTTALTLIEMGSRGLGKLGPWAGWASGQRRTQSSAGQDLVFEGWGESIVEHLLVEDRGDAARHGGHNPHPVCRAAPSAAVFIFHVFNEGLGGRVMVNNGHLVTLREEKGQGVRNEEKVRCSGTFPKSLPRAWGES